MNKSREATPHIMHIKILGSKNCSNCTRLEANAREAIKQLNIEAQIEKIIDFKEILSYGVMMLPGLVIDEKAVSTGRVLSVDDIKKILTK